MENTNKKHPNLLFGVLLAVGFLGLFLPGLSKLTWGSGLETSVAIVIFLLLTAEYRTKRQLLITGAVFCAGYLARYFSVLGGLWLYIVLFLVTGIVLYAIFLLYGHLINRRNSFWMTLAFPGLWTLVYLIATLLRFPTLSRIDVLFVDMNALMQAEHYIGSFGLSFIILWNMALFHFAIRNKRPFPGVLAVCIYFVTVLFGIVYLYPNVTGTESVRIAYATGPYGGDYLNYTAASVDDSFASIEKSAREAARQGAGILMFNEETLEIRDAEEVSFLAKCAETAKENDIHLLIGLDVKDTDGSEGGKALNKIVWISADGTVLGSYEKNKTIPLIEDAYKRGDDQIPSHEITVGGKRLVVSYLICYDSNFPAYVRQVPDETDILFLPSWDWKGVSELHTKLCRCIAAQNHVNLVKCTYDGLSIAVSADGVVIHSSDTAVDGYECVHIVDVPYNGNAEFIHGGFVKRPPVYAIIAVELFSILLCLILLYGNIFETREKTKRNTLFSWLLAGSIFALCADSLSWILDGCERLSPVNYLCTIVSMCMTFVLSSIYISYLTEYIRERKPTNGRFKNIYMLFAGLAILFTLAISFNGRLFSVENGIYSDGPLYTAYLVANVASMAFCLAILIFYRKSLSKHDFIASIAYILLPAVSAAINVFAEDFSYAYAATTLSLIILYVMVQSERVDKLKKNEEIITIEATHDELTGLLNRRAFNDMTGELMADDVPTGIIFADVNGLKFANDTYGHHAGDQLLLTFANLLRNNFRKEEIFRVSGDEFCVVLSGLPKEAFDSRVKRLSEQLPVDGIEIASIGAAYGSSNDAVSLVRAAEANMYVMKDAFHEKHPEMTR